MTEFALIFSLLAFAGCSVGLWIAWQEGFEAGRRRERRDTENADGMGYHGRKFVRALTDVMEVQADGGDHPEAYVAWAVKEAEKIARSKP